MVAKSDSMVVRVAVQDDLSLTDHHPLPLPQGLGSGVVEL
jgi:hypothetical protein